VPEEFHSTKLHVLCVLLLSFFAHNLRFKSYIHVVTLNFRKLQKPKILDFLKPKISTASEVVVVVVVVEKPLNHIWAVLKVNVVSHKPKIRQYLKL